MKVTDPKLAEAVVKLREAQAECETLDAAVESYDWRHARYPIGACGLILPYPEEDMEHFHELGHGAKDLKTDC